MGRAYCATATLLGIACLLFCQSSRAQVTFIAGPETDVAAHPTYITAADFDGDGILDAAVSSTGKPVVSVLFGSQAGFELSGPGLPVGKALRVITTGDFNGDGIIDIVVADYTMREVIVIPGNGNRQFGAPLGYLTTKSPVDVATGYLDCAEDSGSDCAPIDLVTANGNANSITLFFNQGGIQGFKAQPPLTLAGQGFTAIKTADFNADGVDDIAVLATNGAGADSVLVLLNNGNGTFSAVVPQAYRVGVGATALAIGNFHNGAETDSVPDIAVLNSGDSNTPPSIFVLLNDGTGLFPQAVETTIKCPSSSCTAQDIITDDFNQDGLADLAVSFSTSGSAGFVQVYAGSDGAQFLPAQKNPVIISVPRRIAAGNFTGHNDGLKDIAVTEYNTNKVMIVLAVPPPTPTPTRTPTITQTPTITLTPTPAPNGAPCSANEQCVEGNYCVDGVCCSSNDSMLSCTPDTFICSCPAGYICNYSFSLGSCHNQVENNLPCQKNDDCLSGYCLTPTPGANGTPGPGKCAVAPTSTPTRPPTLTPTPTVTPTATPCDEASCEAQGLGWRCDIYGYEGTCSQPLPSGADCQKNADCEQGLICNTVTGLGVCSVPPPATATPPPLTPTSPTPTPTPCPPGYVLTSGVCAQVSRSGGCSIGDRSAQGANAPGTEAWLLALVPLAFGIRRFRRQGAGLTSHRRSQ
jgi:hypothetical protein